MVLYQLGFITFRLLQQSTPWLTNMNQFCLFSITHLKLICKKCPVLKSKMLIISKENIQFNRDLLFVSSTSSKLPSSFLSQLHFYWYFAIVFLPIKTCYRMKTQPWRPKRAKPCKVRVCKKNKEYLKLTLAILNMLKQYESFLKTFPHLLFFSDILEVNELELTENNINRSWLAW